MNAVETIIDARKTSEIELLRTFVERIAHMDCARVWWNELQAAPERCLCPACAARECLATVDLMQDMYRGKTDGAQG